VVLNPHGRPPGSKNKFSRSVKEVIQRVVDKLAEKRGLGDATGALLEWVERDPRNEYAFWKDIWPKLIAARVEETDDRPILHRIEKIIVSERNRDDPLGPYEPPSLDDVGFRVVEERVSLRAPKQEEEKPKLTSGLPL
jgi:hypothetical protein